MKILAAAVVTLSLFAASPHARADVSIDQLQLDSETTFGAVTGDKGKMDLDQVFAQSGLPKADGSVTEDDPTDTPTVPGTYPSQYSSSSYPSQYSASSYPSQYSATSYPSQYSTTSYPSQYSASSYPSQYSASSYPSQYSSSNYPSQYTAGGSVAIMMMKVQAARYDNLPMPKLAQ